MSAGYFSNSNYGAPSVIGGSQPTVRVRHVAGAITSERLYAAANEISRGKAKLVNQAGTDIAPIRIVICPERAGHLASMVKDRSGRIVEAFDPGFDVYILAWSPHSPIVPKSDCRAQGGCSDDRKCCGKCCNNPAKKK